MLEIYLNAIHDPFHDRTDFIWSVLERNEGRRKGRRDTDVMLGFYFVVSLDTRQYGVSLLRNESQLLLPGSSK
jgi:hypothetical protein